MQKLDGKFYGRIYREKDGTEVPPDEFIVFLAKDRALIPTLNFYLGECEALGCESAQLVAVKELIARADQWQLSHLDQMKLPDVHPGEINTECHPARELDADKFQYGVYQRPNTQIGWWYVVRENPIRPRTEYLRDDGTWHGSMASGGGTYHDTEQDARDALRAYRANQTACADAIESSNPR